LITNKKETFINYALENFFSKNLTQFYILLEYRVTRMCREMTEMARYFRGKSSARFIRFNVQMRRSHFSSPRKQILNERTNERTNERMDEQTLDKEILSRDG